MELLNKVKDVGFHPPESNANEENSVDLVIDYTYRLYDDTYEGKMAQKAQKTNQSGQKTNQSAQKTNQSIQKGNQLKQKTNQSEQRSNQSKQETNQSEQQTNQHPRHYRGDIVQTESAEEYK